MTTNGNVGVTKKSNERVPITVTGRVTSFVYVS